VKKTTIFISLLFCLLFSASAQKKQLLTIRFDNRFGSERLQPEQSFYLNENDTLVINRFKYYISHIQLIDLTGKTIVPENQYYLIDIADEKSTAIQLSVPESRYTGIRFLIGVDSIHNVSGVQTGALDPLHGMFWTWNSGYIMAKLEGKASSSMIAGKQFTYHIGGFRRHHNTTRLIELQAPVFTDSLTIIANAATWFNGIHIAKEPVCHSPGGLAVRFADNYSKMFSIQSKQ
jgi:hypothetical protein